MLDVDLTPTDGVTESVPLAEGPGIAILFMGDGRVLFSHLCDRRASNPARSARFRSDAGLIRCAPELDPKHTIDDTAVATLTISPSILCLDCGAHGFVRNGRWVKA